MNTTNGMDHTLCFGNTPNTKRAAEVLKTVICKAPFKNWTSGYDIYTDDVLYFFPLQDINYSHYKNSKKFFELIKMEWKKANFEIVDEKDLAEDEHFHVGFSSHFFRLKSLI